MSKQDKLFSELENLPTEFMTELTEREFLSELSGTKLDAGASTQKSAVSNPLFSDPEPIISESPLGSGPVPMPDGPGARVNVKEIVSGELAIELLDKLLPVLLSMGSERFLNMSVPKKAFQLNASEKNTLAPLMDKCLSQLNINFENPFIALALSAGFIYGSKFIEVSNNPEYKREVKKAQEKVQRTAAAVHTPGLGSDGRPLTRKPGETRGRRPKNLQFT